jgi:hypothetical protein
MNHTERIERGMYERIEAVIDGEEVTIWNWVNVLQPAHVRGHNPTVEKFDARIGAGDMQEPPEYVTERVAEELWHEFGVEAENHGFEVVDPTSDEVQLV